LPLLTANFIKILQPTYKQSAFNAKLMMGSWLVNVLEKFEKKKKKKKEKNAACL
jgi:hypothetical protein